MDPIWAATTELWWVAPVVVGAGGASALFLRRRDARTGRTLAVRAAQHDLRAAHQEVSRRRMAAKVARAEHAHLVASGAGAADVNSSRRATRQSERDVREAVTHVRAMRAHLAAARAERARGELPLPRLIAAHDAVLARWMEYETDPARQIAYPAMSDGRVPTTAAFFAAVERARDLRPRGRTTPAEFTAYRDAVSELTRAFDVAERAAHGANGRPLGWQEAVSRSADALGRAADAAASALAAWTRRPGADDREDRGDRRR
ncbi:hypothetical protein [Microbacterium istanbulense]|uniref:DUF4129 domain-containing protein n=1 Tax=Microbacterium istanbulense TaxID=3122049 RepID=A0ABU8LIH4_9MICO